MKTRILAVDDDPIVLELLSHALELGGYDNVIALQDPIEASELVKSGASFDAIVLDIQMPGLDGIELCQIIRNTDQLRFAPIFMLTAMHEKTYINRSFEAGADDYINKPFDPFDICLRLERAINISKLKQDAEKSKGNDQTHRRRDPALVSLQSAVPEATVRNYLSQLSQCGASHAVVAIQVSNSQVLRDLQLGNYESFLDDIGCAIDECLAEESKLMCYIAHDVFLCVAQTSTSKFDAFFRSSIEERANRRPRLLSSGGKVELKFGDVVRCARFRSVDVDATLEIAIKSLDYVSCFGSTGLEQGALA